MLVQGSLTNRKSLPGTRSAVQKHYHSFALALDNVIELERFAWLALHLDYGVNHSLQRRSEDQGVECGMAVLYFLDLV